MWRSKPLIPACGKMRQWLSEGEARLIYIVSSWLSQKKKNKHAWHGEKGETWSDHLATSSVTQKFLMIWNVS